MPLAFSLRVFFLQFGGVQQHNPGYFGRGVGTVYLASEAIAHQLGQQTAVIKMRMSQENRLKASG
jgi:hypothetical protein